MECLTLRFPPSLRNVVFGAGVPLIFLSCVSLSLLSALLIILNPVITINYTINYTNHCTRGYNVEQVGTRKIAMSLKIKNIMNNVAHYETAKNTNL
ncbi:hypothetical protein ACVXHA_13390 [Escherichia coli]